jgi:hypothetical protein
MSFETINNRITQIENKITEIDSLVNVKRGQKPIEQQLKNK